MPGSCFSGPMMTASGRLFPYDVRFRERQDRPGPGAQAGASRYMRLPSLAARLEGIPAAVAGAVAIAGGG